MFIFNSHAAVLVILRGRLPHLIFDLEMASPVKSVWT
jgi:hypothetical protein